MFVRTSTSEHNIRGLTIRYVAVLASLALFSVLGYFFLSEIISEQSITAARINLAGRQRMLLQKASLLRIGLDQLDDGPERAQAHQKLTKTLHEMENAHESLLHGNAALGIPPTRSQPILALYYGPKGFLNRELEGFLSDTRRLLYKHRGGAPPHDENHDRLSDFTAQTFTPFAGSLDLVVSAYQKESEEKIWWINTLLTLSLGVFLALLLLSAFGVFRPALKKIKEQIDTLRLREEELLKATEQAQAASQAKSNFLTIMSHELRTPLNPIIGFAKMMQEAENIPDRPEFRVYPRLIQESGEHLLQILSDILDLSKIESGKLEAKSTSVDLEKVVDSCLRIIKGSAAIQNVELRTECASGLPALRGDERAIRQIVLNLLSNAVKFTENGGTVTACLRQAGAGGLEIEVADTGIGMTPEEIETAFKAFVQVDSSLGRKQQGTGLGLTLVRKLVELHDGVFKLESEPGTGTVATVYFPPSRTMEPAETEAEERDRSCLPETSSRKILAVEDDPVNLLLLSTILEKSGHRVECAEDGKTAIHMIRKGDFDLVLSDIQMPEVSGYDVARAVRKMPGTKASIPMIAVTACAMQEDQEKCFAAGFNEYVSKPVRKEAILGAMDKVFNGAVRPS